MKRLPVSPALALGLAACGSPALFLPIPADETQLALILALQTSGEIRDVLAFDLPLAEDSIRLPTPVELGSGIELEAISYAVSLFDLGLEAGEIHATTKPPGAEVPAGGTVYLAELEEEPPRWQPVKERSTALKNFRVDLKRPECRKFEPAPFAIPDPSRGVTFLLDLGDDSLLIGVESNRAFRLRGDDLLEVQMIGALGPITDATFQSQSEQIWMIDRSARLYRAELTTPDLITLTPEPMFRFGGNSPWQLVVRTSSVTGEFEAFAMSLFGELLRSIPGSTTVVAALNAVQLSTGLIETEDGKIIASAGSFPEILHYDGNGGVRRETVGPGVGFTALCSLPGSGAIAGNAEGNFYRLEGDVWSPLPGSPLRLNPFALTAFEAGFLYAGAFGTFGQYASTGGFCDLDRNIAANTLDEMIVFGDEVILAGDNPNLTEIPVVRLSH